MKSGCAKRYAFQKFWGGGGGKGDLEKSRFDWVFLNDGVPKYKLIKCKLFKYKLILSSFYKKFFRLSTILQLKFSPFWTFIRLFDSLKIIQKYPSPVEVGVARLTHSERKAWNWLVLSLSTQDTECVTKVKQKFWKIYEFVVYF